MTDTSTLQDYVLTSTLYTASIWTQTAESDLKEA